MESDAKAYSVLNKPQYVTGCNFVRALDLSKGYKVLDLGCGTGELTKFIADIVGADGEVVGVDPDEARIKLAQDKFKDVQNVKFLVGNSVTGFPHDNDQYYDLHFSNHVFHWVKEHEKQLYVEKAYDCLKPGGRVAVLTAVKPELKPDQKMAVEFLAEEEYRQLFQGQGLFTDVVTELTSTTSEFASVEEFKDWFKASNYLKLDELDPQYMKGIMALLTKKQDGRFTFETKGMVRITGKKGSLGLGATCDTKKEQCI